MYLTKKVNFKRRVKLIEGICLFAIIAGCQGTSTIKSKGAEKESETVNEIALKEETLTVPEDEIIPVEGTVQEDHSFDLELKEFGKVRFITSLTEGGINFYLTYDSNPSKVFYRFPLSFKWRIEEVRGVGFYNLNADGFKDVIVSVSASSGVGKAGGVTSFTSNEVFLREGQEFITDPNITSILNSQEIEGLLEMRDYLKRYFKIIPNNYKIVSSGTGDLDKDLVQ